MCLTASVDLSASPVGVSAALSSLSLLSQTQAFMELLKGQGIHRGDSPFQ